MRKQLKLREIIIPILSIMTIITTKKIMTNKNDLKQQNLLLKTLKTFFSFRSLNQIITDGENIVTKS